MNKKRYNWKARQVVETIIDDNPTKKIKLDLDHKGTYDQSNELVLPSKKRKTKIKNKLERVTRILSNKQRKKLEKIVEKKKKKLNRASLLEKLSKVQATPEELQKLTSIATVQTKGLKKFLAQEKVPKVETDTNPKRLKINILKGAKREPLTVQIRPVSNDPNIVGFESSSDSDSDENEDTQNTSHSKKEETIGSCKDKDSDVKQIVTPAIIDKVIDKTKTEVNIKAKNEKPPTIFVRKPAVFVEVERSNEIQKARLKLPILAEEQEIMEIISQNSVIIIAGETGSGKTTQVPQFLYEGGYALKKMIGITEPRRVAAISMAKRVADEMNLTSDEVSYLIRFEGNVTENTKIKFMTDGVLLKELRKDFLLTKYSVIILDEAHERSVYTDVLVGMLSRIVPLRIKRCDPLKLIIMSATLRLEDFTENKLLFKTPPPVIDVETRQFSVTVHFNRRTNENYLKEALRKTVKIHTTLPEGGILVFVTGQREVNHLVRKLRSMFPLKRKEKFLKVVKTLKGNDEDVESSEDEDFETRLKKLIKKTKKNVKIVPDIDLDDYTMNDEENNSNDEEDAFSDDDFDGVDVMAPINAHPLWVLPLYSFLPPQKQARVFEQAPSGCRLCVVSTNVAETSLTIPNIKYVVDTGKTKIKLYDKITGVTSHVVSWTSKASANQRAGRAGRTAAGHCYRLYSSAVFNDIFQQFSTPEIQRKPIDDLYLQMKCMHLHKIVNFPFPTAPDLTQLRSAESRLHTLQLLEDSRPTALGRVVAKLSVLPRFGKMLALSCQCGVIAYTICIVAALSVQEVLLETPVGQNGANEKWAASRRRSAGQGNSLLLGDPMVLLKAVGGAEYANFEGKLQKFCENHGLRYKAVLEIRKLRKHLTNEIKSIFPDYDITVDPKLTPPDDRQCRLLRQILLSGMGDQVAKRIDPEEVKHREDRAKFKYAYRANDMEQPVFLHRSSVLTKTLPEYIIYQEAYETNKMYVRGITAIDSDWLAVYVPKLCNFGAPFKEPEPRFDDEDGKVKCRVSGTFGRQAWPLHNVEIEYPTSTDAYKWFAKFFIEGKVFGKLEKYEKSLLQPANLVTKPWAKLQPRIVGILNRMAGADCRTRSSVEKIWEKNPRFLLQEYLSWLPDSAHGEVSLIWPPSDN